jgi:hypothetical protein
MRCSVPMPTPICLAIFRMPQPLARAALTRTSTFAPTGGRHQDAVGAPPCDDCPHARVCRLGFACERFRGWSVTGFIDPARSRVPRRSIYKKMFTDVGAPMVDALLLAARAA